MLLGNGFSIACRPDSFSYGRLFDEADFSTLSIGAEGLFGYSGTADFERAIEALRVSAFVLDLYDQDSELSERIRNDAQVLKEALAAVLAKKHPENVGEISDAEYARARTFLDHFSSGRIFTVNYDLLLYWTLLQDLEPKIKADDGFREDPDEPDAEWVTWDGYAGHSQRIYFLHGGLHLFDAGSTLRKVTWTRTGRPLIDQIREALAIELYPHVVTEGSSQGKLARIEHSPYLHKGLKSLKSCVGSPVHVRAFARPERRRTFSVESKRARSSRFTSASTEIQSQKAIARFESGRGSSPTTGIRMRRESRRAAAVR